MRYTTNLETTLKHFTSSGAFLTSKSDVGVNTMTIGWGFIGVTWGKPCFMALVRPKRHTKFILDYADSFTVSVPYGNLREELKECGTKSGKDIDKSKIVEFLDSKTVDTPIVKNCFMYYECKINYVQQLNADMLPAEIKENFYKDGEFHYLYIGEIVECYDETEIEEM